MDTASFQLYAGRYAGVIPHHMSILQVSDDWYRFEVFNEHIVFEVHAIHEHQQRILKSFREAHDFHIYGCPVVVQDRFEWSHYYRYATKNGTVLIGCDIRYDEGANQWVTIIADGQLLTYMDKQQVDDLYNLSFS